MLITAHGLVGAYIDNQISITSDFIFTGRFLQNDLQCASSNPGHGGIH